MSGYNGNVFKPSNPITRQEAAVMIARIVPAYGYTGNLNSFPDASSTADWAYASMQKVNGKGYIGAYSDGKLHPTASLTRAQTAKIIDDITDRETIVTDTPTVSGGKTLKNTIYSNGVALSNALGCDKDYF